MWKQSLGILLFLVLGSSAALAANSAPPVVPAGELLRSDDVGPAALAGGSAAALAWSPDGRWLAVPGDDSVQIWDLARGTEVALLRGHQGGIVMLAWSPDGQRLATGSSDRTARIWDPVNGRELAVLRGHDGAVFILAWSPDGRRIATSSFDNPGRVWDAATGMEVAALQGHDSSIFAVAWSPDGRWLATGSIDTSARIWDAENGKEVKRLQGHSQAIYELAWSPDGRRLATGSSDHSARIWDTIGGTELALLRGDEETVFFLAWSPDGRRLATKQQKSTRIWDAANGAELAVLRGSFSNFAWSPDSLRLAAGSRDNSARIWDAASGAEIAALRGSASILIWSPDGRQLATGSDSSTRIWDAASATEVALLRARSSGLNALAWSRDGQRLATGSSANSAHIWDLASGTEVALLRGHGGSINTLAWSPDGRRLATGSSDNSARVWDPASGSEVALLRGHSGSINTLAWSPDGRWLATGSSDNSARVWDPASGSEVALLRGHSGSIDTLAWSPDGRRLATGSGDNSARIWDAASGTEVALLRGHNGSISILAWSPDGRRLATGSTDGTARIWDAANSREVALLRRRDSGNDTPGGRDGSISTLAWSPDSRRLATGSGDNSARIWDATSGNEVAQLSGHGGTVNVLAWSPDGRRLATGSSDNSARVWEAARGTQVALLRGHERRVTTLAWSPDGRRLATGGADGRAVVWEDARALQRAVLIGGRDGRWIACRFPARTCLRHDDGSLMREFDAGKIRPIPPPADSDPPKFELDPDPASVGPISVDDGVPRSLPFRLRNVGGRAFGVQLRAVNLDDGTTDGSFAQVTAEAQRPQGDSAAADAAPRRNLGYAAVTMGRNESLEGDLIIVGTARLHDPRPARLRLGLAVRHAHGEQSLQEIALDIRAPQLEIGLAELSEETPNLTVRIDNKGPIPARGLIVQMALKSRTAEGFGPPSELRTIPSVEPAASARVAEPLVYRLTDELAARFRKDDKKEITLSLKTDFSSLSGLLSNSRPFHTWELAAPSRLTPAAGISLITWFGGALALMAVLYGGLVFGNPVLARASAVPGGLTSIGITQLPKARRLLMLAGRLNSVLASANVPKRRLDSAVVFAGDLAAKNRAAALADRLEMTLAGDFQTTAKGIDYVDAITPERLLLNLPRVRLAFPRPDMPADEIFTDIRKIAMSPDLMTVIVSATAAQAAALRMTTRDRIEPVATLTDAELTGVMLSAEPLLVFAQSIADQAPPARLSAYQRGGGVGRAAAFFGRERELSNILNREPANYFVIGGRQVGKSSLLKEIKRRLDARKTLECSYMTLIDEDIRAPLTDALGLPDDTTLEDIYSDLRRPNMRRMILIDEADKFIVHEAVTGYRNLAMFRRLSEEGRAYFILAGFWDLYRMIAFDYASPLRNFGEQVRIGGLDEDACRQMATQPMTALNLTYEKPESIGRIHQSTAGRANLVSIACDLIVKSMGRDERIIPDQHVDEALQSFELRGQLEGWSELSGRSPERQRANGLDRIVVYSTVDRDGFVSEDIQQIVKQASLDYSSEDIRESLARLTLAFIISRDNDGRYRFVVPVFVEMLKELDIAEAKRHAIDSARAKL